MNDETFGFWGRDIVDVFVRRASNYMILTDVIVRWQPFALLRLNHHRPCEDQCDQVSLAIGAGFLKQVPHME